MHGVGRDNAIFNIRRFQQNGGVSRWFYFERWFRQSPLPLYEGRQRDACAREDEEAGVIGDEMEPEVMVLTHGIIPACAFLRENQTHFAGLKDNALGGYDETIHIPQ